MGKSREVAISRYGMQPIRNYYMNDSTTVN